MKFQLDVEALKYLIERGGPEFELELRNGVVANLVKGYSALIAGETVRKLAGDSVRAEVANQIGAMKQGSWTIQPTVDPKLKEAIREVVVAVVKEETDKVMEQARSIAGEAARSIDISKAVKLRFETVKERLISAEVERRLKEIIDAANEAIRAASGVKS